MLKDFKKFIVRGNVVDLAVAVIIGGAFGKIVSSFVNDIIMPLIGRLLGGVDFKTLKWVLEEAVGETPEVAVLYGQFIQNVVDFVIIAFVIFMMIKMIEKMRPKPVPEPAAPAAPSEDVQLLTEIRDLLKAQSK
ncbi:MAG TPA: large conductance mechanosensitive channel protein MscL [Clostridiales bacterium UBA8960]|jgi:large conductance mechanosensitive channel|nr:large conductance mechanosensitive channel protein MscL [Clostridiales bacterium UBA8960]